MFVLRFSKKLNKIGKNYSGYIEECGRPYIYQKFFISLYLSKKGKHYLDGGVYLVDMDFNKYSLEDMVDEGDLSFGFGTIFHGVDVPKPIANSEDDEYMGRWWLGIYSTESDYNKDKHTGKPALK